MTADILDRLRAARDDETTGPWSRSFRGGGVNEIIDTIAALRAEVEALKAGQDRAAKIKAALKNLADDLGEIMALCPADIRLAIGEGYMHLLKVRLQAAFEALTPPEV